MPSNTLGIVAGNTNFPLRVARDAKAEGLAVHAVCYEGETPEGIESIADSVEWIKVGELGRLIGSFKSKQVSQVVFAGGINRVKLFGGVKLDLKGAALIAKLRSTKDDIIMRGIASELEGEGISVESCTMFCKEWLTPKGVLTKKAPSKEEQQDIEVGIEAIKKLGELHIGQLVVVKEGVIVAVEAVEGSDAAIKRGGELGKDGTVVIKFSKPTQDMRFDVPTVGLKTIESLESSGAKVLGLEADKSIILDKPEVIEAADKAKISIVGL